MVSVEFWDVSSDSAGQCSTFAAIMVVSKVCLKGRNPAQAFEFHGILGL